MHFAIAFPTFSRPLKIRVPKKQNDFKSGCLKVRVPKTKEKSSKFAPWKFAPPKKYVSLNCGPLKARVPKRKVKFKFCSLEIRAPQKYVSFSFGSLGNPRSKTKTIRVIFGSPKKQNPDGVGLNEDFVPPEGLVGSIA